MKAEEIEDYVKSVKSILRPEIARFAMAMEAKMRTHDDDRGDGWKGATPTWLIKLLKGELDEVEKAMEEVDPKKISAELVDVANFAMMAFSLLVAKIEEEE